PSPPSPSDCNSRVALYPFLAVAEKLLVRTAHARCVGLQLPSDGDLWQTASMARAPTLTEADILAKVIGDDQPTLTPEAARSLLTLQFDKEATRDIRGLLQKNNRGKITADERMTLERYLRVGQFLDLLQAKARLSLQ